MKTWNKKCSNKAECNNGIPLNVTNQTDPSIKKENWDIDLYHVLLSYWIDNTLFLQMQVLLVHFVYYNMVLKMSYPLSHTVVNKKKKIERKGKKEQ